MDKRATEHLRKLFNISPDDPHFEHKVFLAQATVDHKNKLEGALAAAVAKLGVSESSYDPAKLAVVVESDAEGGWQKTYFYNKQVLLLENFYWHQGHAYFGLAVPKDFGSSEGYPE